MSSGTRWFRLSHLFCLEPRWFTWCDSLGIQKKKKQHRSGCHNTSQESNVNHWPTLPLIYSCIANTKTPNPCGICHLTPQESFYGVMSSRPIVINEPPHSSACLSINFQGGPPSYVPTLLCSGRTWNNCHAKSRTFPFLILRVNSILIQF